jgi:ParB-like chromosome segregation protein Spo0J
LSAPQYPDHLYATAFPLLGEAEERELAQDIKANGLREPIMLYKDAILDGRNRFRACLVAGVKPRFEQFGGDDEAALAFVISRNLKRRHLTVEQRAEIGDTLASSIPSRDGIRLTQAQAAKQVGVGRATVERFHQVKARGTPELLQAVRERRIPIRRAAEIARKPLPEQAPEIARRYATTGSPRPANDPAAWCHARDVALALIRFGRQLAHEGEGGLVNFMAAHLRALPEAQRRDALRALDLLGRLDAGLKHQGL